MYTRKFTKPHACPGQDTLAQKRSENTQKLYLCLISRLSASKKCTTIERNNSQKDSTVELRSQRKN